MRNKTAIAKQIKDKKIFENDKLYRESEKYFYSGEYYKMTLRMKYFKKWLKLINK